ncbi:hypothetical protein [Streptomyces sp. x-80]|uniref:hypothetical protein n=1 Tax=Streptomyces sp. x-80 TaxID=2789282 RepID=UPI00398004EC
MAATAAVAATGMGTAAADVARTAVHMAVHMAAPPLEASVRFATVTATNMPYIGRG